MDEAVESVAQLRLGGNFPSLHSEAQLQLKYGA